MSPDSTTVEFDHGGDDNLVLRKSEVSHSGHTRGKLAPNWEGLYQVICSIRDGTYILATMDNGRPSASSNMTYLKPEEVLCLKYWIKVGHAVNP
ncbi:hypothetical protein BHM03_00002170 [Ensete ventricosum]|nr:hypothetical protein BHM03_00002170 [Ensete ventricosum]